MITTSANQQDGGLEVVTDATRGQRDWLALLKRTINEGNTVSPRGLRTHELIGVQFRYNAASLLNVPITNPTRAASIIYAWTEALFKLTGRNDTALIKRFPKTADYYHTPSEYGPRLRGRFNAELPAPLGAGKDQFRACANMLGSDPFTRQAVMSVYSYEDTTSEDRTVPCTLTYQFINNAGYLDLIVTMRSQDAWLGHPVDRVVAAVILHAMALIVKLPPCNIHWQAGSFHVYERDVDLARKAIGRGVIDDSARRLTATNQAALWHRLVAQPVLELATDDTDVRTVILHNCCHSWLDSILSTTQTESV